MTGWNGQLTNGPDLAEESRSWTATPQGKVKSVAELGEIAERARSQGRIAVLCHGVFDLFHVGHVRHLRAARREGDLLMVTLTADKHVNKGPGRPVFTERLRAEMIAALEFVDFVAINDAPSAEPVLNAVRPDVYVKGSDYKRAEDDVTGGIVAERGVVEGHGGRVVFTEDITFSSSELINRHLDVYEPTLAQHLERMRATRALDRLLGFMDRIKEFHVAIVGDTIVDEYQYVVPMGKSAKENMIATLYRDHEVFAGGVIAAANHLATFCKSVEILTCLGASDPHEALIRDCLKPNVTLTAIERPGSPTTRKCRFVDTDYSMRKLFEIYHMNDQPLSPALQDEFDTLIASRIKSADLTVVTDFGHGLISRSSIGVLGSSKFLAVNAQSNSANYGFNLITKYPRADYVCLDGPEARLAIGDKFVDPLTIAAQMLPELIECPRLVVTQGKHGCFAFERSNGIIHVPALTSTIVDTVGAGDAFFAVSSLFAAAKATIEDIAFVGNAAGAMKVGIVGHRSSVERTAFIKYLTAILK
jgi:rfaE bifunctional protein nucleotidyltransferase chain/domain